MTHAEKRTEQTRLINRQRAAIGAIYLLCGGGKLKENRLSNMLLAIEKRAHKSAEDYCNGKITTDQWGKISEKYAAEVQTLFNNKLQGLIINGDARGYALKIHDRVLNITYKDIPLHRDFGGYGILGPTFDL